MSKDHNPLKDLFPNFDADRLENDTIEFFSNVVRENERNLNAIKECLHDMVSNTDHTEPTPKGDLEPQYDYQCPFPERSSPITEDDVCSYPHDDVIDVQYVEADDTPKGTVDSGNVGIDPFSPAPASAPERPLTDREVLDKTASMWEYHPVASDLQPFPESTHQTSTTPYAEIVASRVRGKKHKHNATNCDDYFEHRLVGNSCIVALSDGAGSKAYSRIGAKEVTTSYVRAMGDALTGLLKDATFLEGLSYPVTDALFNRSCGRIAIELQNAVKSAYSALSCKFEELRGVSEYSKPLGRELDVRDLSCTLLAGVIIPIETTNGVETFVITLQIGDGLVCSIDATKPFESSIKLLGVSDSGNFSGETEFITSTGMVEQSNLMRRIKVMKGKSSAILFATDGVSDDYFPNDTKACNLYNDLVLNGVIPIEVSNDSSIKIVPPIREQKTIESVPKDVCVAYSEDFLEFFGISEETLWNDKSYVQNAVSVYGQCFSKSHAENLQSWLDNYTRRGSFDDRTLFLYRPTK